MRTRWTSAVLAAGVAVASCGGRAEIWDQSVSESTMAQGLRDAVAVVDDPAHRVLLMRAAVDQSLVVNAVPVGHGVVATAASADGGKLLVLCAGDQPRTKPSDEMPSLTVVDTWNPGAPVRYELPDVFTSLAIDPNGSRVIIYAGDSTIGNFIKNPNELLLVDITKPYGDDNPTARTLPSLLGGYPKRLTFAPGMNVGRGAVPARELLLVESDFDVMIVDLDHPERPEITMPLTDRSQNTVRAPAAVAFEPGASGRDPVVAVRSDTDNVYMFSLKTVDKPDPGDNDFMPIPNTIAVGGVPTDFAFVRTNTLQVDDGVRLAVLAPRPSGLAALVNEVDGTVLDGSSKGSYQRMSVGAQGGLYDQLLLYNSVTTNEKSVAMWNLANAPDVNANAIQEPRPIPLDASVLEVLDVPGTALKVFKTSSSAMYVFDLEKETAPRLNTSASVEMRIARDGLRAWAFVGGAPQLDKLDLAGPHVEPVLIDRAISDVYEIERGGYAKALVVLHGTKASSGAQSPFGWHSGVWQGGAGVTVFDAVVPDPMTGKRYSGVLLEGLIQ